MRTRYIVHLIFCIAIAFISTKSFAQKRFSGGAMLFLGPGSMGNSTDVASRSMMYTPIALFGGFNMKKFRLGFNYEYNLAGQTADPADVGNQNIGGKGSGMGLRLEYYDGIQSIGVITKLSETYTLDKPTLLGDTASYTGVSGMNLQYYRRFRNNIGFVFDYAIGELKSDKTLTDNIKYDRIGIGLVFTSFSK